MTVRSAAGLSPRGLDPLSVLQEIFRASHNRTFVHSLTASRAAADPAETEGCVEGSEIVATKDRGDYRRFFWTCSTVPAFGIATSPSWRNVQAIAPCAGVESGPAATSASVYHESADPARRGYRPSPRLCASRATALRPTTRQVVADLIGRVSCPTGDGNFSPEGSLEGVRVSAAAGAAHRSGGAAL